MASETVPRIPEAAALAESLGAIEHSILDDHSHLQARREFIAKYPDFAEQSLILADRLANNPAMNRKDLFQTGVELGFLVERHQKAASALFRLFTQEVVTASESVT